MSRTPFLYSLTRSSSIFTAALCRSLSFFCSSLSPPAIATGLRMAWISGLIFGPSAGVWAADLPAVPTCDEARKTAARKLAAETRVDRMSLLPGKARTEVATRGLLLVFSLFRQTLHRQSRTRWSRPTACGRLPADGSTQVGARLATVVVRQVAELRPTQSRARFGAIVVRQAAREAPDPGRRLAAVVVRTSGELTARAASRRRGRADWRFRRRTFAGCRAPQRDGGNHSRHQNRTLHRFPSSSAAVEMFNVSASLLAIGSDRSGRFFRRVVGRIGQGQRNGRDGCHGHGRWNGRSGGRRGGRYATQRRSSYRALARRPDFQRR